MSLVVQTRHRVKHEQSFNPASILEQDTNRMMRHWTRCQERHQSDDLTARVHLLFDKYLASIADNLHDHVLAVHSADTDSLPTSEPSRVSRQIVLDMHLRRYMNAVRTAVLFEEPSMAEWLDDTSAIVSRCVDWYVWCTVQQQQQGLLINQRRIQCRAVQLYKQWSPSQDQSDVIDILCYVIAHTAFQKHTFIEFLPNIVDAWTRGQLWIRKRTDHAHANADHEPSFVRSFCLSRPIHLMDGFCVVGTKSVDMDGRWFIEHGGARASCKRHPPHRRVEQSWNILEIELFEVFFGQRRHGHGERMLTSLLHVWKQQQIHVVRLRAWDSAVAFWEKMRFVLQEPYAPSRKRKRVDQVMKWCRVWLSGYYVRWLV